MAKIFLGLLLLGAGFALTGCSGSAPVDTSSGSFGKSSNATELPPQGKPPEPGAGMKNRAPQSGSPGAAR
jgi:hypothetical protein